jgi:hypothetical protein
MRGSRFRVGTLAVLTSVILTSSAAAIPITADDFEDGTTMGWFVGDPTHPAPPVNIATGGPAGAGDNYLQLVATGGGGAGGRLAVLNDAQWARDYLAAGIKAIVMAVNNFGPDEVTLRPARVHPSIWRRRSMTSSSPREAAGFARSSICHQGISRRSSVPPQAR